MKLALSALCENPARQTGLTTMFLGLLEHSLRLHSDLEWIVFTGPNQPLDVSNERLHVVREFPAGDRLAARLAADHFRVSHRARDLGARGLVTVGFVPLRSALPTFMHITSLQHLSQPSPVAGPALVRWARRTRRMLRQAYRGWMIRRGLRDAALVIVNSQTARAQLLEAFPLREEKIVVSHEGTLDQCRPEPEPGEIQAMQRELDLAPGYLLWVSNFYNYKQAPLLLEGYARLPEALRARVPLVMVGADWGGGLAAAQVVVEARGLQGQVRFPGWVADRWLAPLYRHALAFCLPSRLETFGRCTMEAMACGTPCVLNDIPINREVSGGHALLIDFADRERVAQALRQICEDANLRQQLRERGLAHAKQFTFEHMARTRLDAILDWLAARESGSLPA
jgi:glycosyltransferase involved in cell wall biosynthesis